MDGSFFDSVAVINRILVQQIFSDAQVTKMCQMGQSKTKSNDLSLSASGVEVLFDPSTGSKVTVATTKKAVSLETLNEGPQCVYELVEERSVEFLQIRKTDIDVVRSGEEGHSKVAVLDGAGGPLEAFGPESNSGYYGFPIKAPAAVRRKAPTTAGDFYHNAIYASGGVLVGGLLDHVLYQLYSNPSILQLIKLLCGIRTKADVKRDFHLFKQYGSGCYLECIPVPDGFGVETLRKANKTTVHHRSDSESSSTGESDDSSHDEDESDSRHGKNKKKSSKNGPETSFSRAKSKGKKKITEFLDRASHLHFHHEEGGSNNSVDSDYMYDNRHKNFLHLYEHLALDQGVVPIGLLRLQGDDPKTVHLGIGGSSRCYAITNPLLDTIVLDTDMVFVLTRDYAQNTDKN